MSQATLNAPQHHPELNLRNMFRYSRVHPTHCFMRNSMVIVLRETAIDVILQFVYGLLKFRQPGQ